ncbi:MAG TPA: hypothetical protein VGK73_33680, partial [Polyangiaceae bacterium]
MRRRGLISARCAVLVLIALSAATALARPGSGETFSGGSDLPTGGGGGGGEVDIGLLIELAYLCYQYPPLGAVVLVGAAGYFVWKQRAARGQKDWSTGMPARVEVRTRTQRARADLAALNSSDPGFSLVLFEDFAYALYAEIQMTRARGGIGRLAAFLSPEVARLLYDPALERVDGIVVGSLRYASAELGAERTRVTLELEGNLTEHRQGQAQRYYVKDRLTLTRAKTARSRPAQRVRKLDCP